MNLDMTIVYFQLTLGNFVFNVIDLAVKNVENFDVDVTKFFQIVKTISLNLNFNIDKDLFQDDICIYASTNNSHYVKLQIYRSEELLKTTSIEYSKLAFIIKVVYNYMLTNEIIKYMMFFGFHDGEQCTMYSDTSNYTCLLFEACIELRLIPSNYTDFHTEINVETGEILMR